MVFVGALITILDLTPVTIPVFASEISLGAFWAPPCVIDDLVMAWVYLTLRNRKHACGLIVSSDVLAMTLITPGAHGALRTVGDGVGARLALSRLG